MRRARLAAAASAALLAAACGGAREAAPPAPTETVIGKAPEKDAVPRRTLEDLRREFLAMCTVKVPTPPDYCACSWEQMAKTFSAEEMTSPTADPTKQGVLKERIEVNCAPQPPAR